MTRRIPVAALVALLVGVAGAGEVVGGSSERDVAVVHDAWFQPRRHRYNDLMLSAVLAELRAVLPPLRFVPVALTAFEVPGGSDRAWEGVVALGGCRVQRALERMEEQMRVPVLYVSWSTCRGARQRSENTVVLNDIQFHMRYSCLVWVLRQWATSFLLARPTPFNRRHNLNISLGTKEAFVAEDIMYRCAGMVEVGNMYRARKVLRGRVLRIVTIHRPPFVFLEMNSEGKITRTTGFAFEMLKELQRKLGFRYELVLPYDGNWGNKLKNGTWNGMVGMVHRKEVDLGVAPFTITLGRAEAIDFTFPFYVEPSAVLTPAGATSKKILAFLSPFTFEVWLGVLISFVVLGPIMLAFSRTSSSAFLYPHNAYSASRRVSLSGYYWMLCASLFQQGVTYPLSSPARVVFGAWIVGVIALTCAYTGVLISFLTVPRAENGVEDLHSLPKQSEFLWTFKRNSAHHSLFLGKDTTGIYAQIGAPFIGNEDELVDDNEDGIRKVLERTHVYIKERSFLDFVVEENFRRSGQCNLRIARGEFFPAGFGWIHQKGDDIGKLFNKEFILMQQTGLFAKWKLQYWPKANKCTNGGSRSLMQALDIEDMAGSFVVLSSGFVSGVFLLVMEYFCKFRKVERAPAPKSRGKAEDPQLTVDEISERDIKTLSGTEVSSTSADRPQPKEIFQILKTQKVE